MVNIQDFFKAEKKEKSSPALNIKFRLKKILIIYYNYC